MDHELDDFALEVFTRLAHGVEVVTRLRTSQWFTYGVDGEDILVGPEVQAAIEQAAGARLVEFKRRKYPGEFALGFRKADRAQVLGLLAMAKRFAETS